MTEEHIAPNGVMVMASGTMDQPMSIDPDLRGRMTVATSSFNPDTGMVEETDVLHRYVEFDSMTNEELSEAHSALYGSEISGFYDENRERMKKWTGKRGFDFVTETAR